MDAGLHRRGSKAGQKEKPKEIEKLEKRLTEVGGVQKEGRGMGIAQWGNEFCDTLHM